MDFDALPYNVSGVFAMGIDKYGCAVFVPCIDERDAERVKVDLQAFLASQPDPEGEETSA